MADSPGSPAGSAGPAPDALALAMAQLLAPLARLALARGVNHAALDDWLKRALVAAADQAHAELPPHRRVSRITTATGIHRREVSRLLPLLRQGDSAPATGRSHAAELFAQWRTDPVYTDRRGSPLELARQGPAPSFESLAQATTRDVHPRSLMDELLRLGLAAHDSERDTLRLLREAFVPTGDPGRMLRVLGNNVGSHLAGAVDNVLGDGRAHFEQALFAGGLSDASMQQARGLVSAQWQALMDALVPALQAMVARDAVPAPTESGAPEPSTAAPERHHLRLGLYSFSQPESALTGGGAGPAPPPAPSRTPPPTPLPKPPRPTRKSP